MSAWPEPDADNVCAPHARYFQHGGLRCETDAWYKSPLLRDGPEQPALLLGLVWGSGFRVFGNRYAVPVAAAAAMPLRHAMRGPGTGGRSVALILPGYGPRLRSRPLAIGELRDFARSAIRRAKPKHERAGLGAGCARRRRSAGKPEDRDRRGMATRLGQCGGSIRCPARPASCIVSGPFGTPHLGTSTMEALSPLLASVVDDSEFDIDRPEQLAPGRSGVAQSGHSADTIGPDDQPASSCADQRAHSR